MVSMGFQLCSQIFLEKIKIYSLNSHPQVYVYMDGERNTDVQIRKTGSTHILES
jgi:hypothetical protein